MPSPIRIAIVCGTRPEVIKLAPVYHALAAQPWAQVEWIHTGQHTDMAESIMDCFGITPTLRLARTGSRIEDFSVECRRQLDQAMQERGYRFCVVQGDTESAFLGALVAFYRRIPVGHVEAGLRTYNLDRPFPEEGLRQMISRIADLHFAPTRRAVDALRTEGIAPAKIEMTGNTVVDAQQWIRRRHAFDASDGSGKQILVTVHRREHWGQEMETIFKAVQGIASEHPDHDVLFPVHLNPIVRDAAHRLLSGLGNVRLVPPLDYLQMQRALSQARLVLTDSGGLQEEAPTYQVPVLVLRHETERPEAVEAGFAFVVGPDDARIRAHTRRLLQDTELRVRLRRQANPYGDGHAARRIAAGIAGHFGITDAAVPVEAGVLEPAEA
jgi:UDP-N-acetylglucosamine 2-epimerase (non-hydrolysing)